MSKRAWKKIMTEVASKESIWEKLGNPTVGRGITQWPKGPNDQERHGVRFDYDGVVVEGNQRYHKWQVQPNAGKIPSSWEDWRNKNGGTHAVIGTIKVKDKASKAEVEEALNTLKFG